MHVCVILNLSRNLCGCQSYLSILVRRASNLMRGESLGCMRGELIATHHSRRRNASKESTGSVAGWVGDVI